MANIVYYEDIQLVDNVKLIAGTSSDIQIYTDNSNNILDFFNLSNVLFRQHFLDGDMTFQSDDGSGGVATYFKLDGGDGLTLFSKNVKLSDSVELRLGNSNDLVLKHNATNSVIDNITGNLIIQNQNNDADIVFNCDNGSGGLTEYMRIDGGDELIKASKNIKFHDNVQAWFGGSNDLRIYHNGTNSNIENYVGTLQFVQNLNDGDIIFKSDNGSGGTADYLVLDGSQVSIRMKRLSK